MIPFGEWLPDHPAFANPGATVATNVIPGPGGGYRPFPDLVSFPSALDARAQGAFAVIGPDGTVSSFAGSASRLYRLDNASWTQINSGFATAPEAQWAFTQFGNLVIAVNFTDAPQKFNLAMPSGTFAALGGSPPKAKFVAVVREQVVLAHLVGQPQRVQWSGLDDAEDWTVSAVTQADFNDVVGDHGHITGLAGGDYGVLFCERAIFRMDYIGAPVIYQFTRVEQGRGCACPGSIAPLGRLVFYLSDDGFYMFDGIQSLPIGKNKVDRSFYADLDQANSHRVTAAIDPVNSLVIWAYPGVGNVGGNPNRLLIHNWTSGRWSRADIEVEMLWRDLSKGYTLDSLDIITASLDALPFSLDSRVYAGGKLLLAAFDADHRLGHFTGPNLPATIETAEAALGRGERAFLSAVRPMIDTSDLTVRVAGRERVMDAVSFSSPSAVNAAGYCSVRSSARLHRARIAIDAGASWDHAQGIEVDAVPDGSR